MTNQPKFELNEMSSGSIKLYEIRQLTTTGWELNDENDTNLTREQCDDRIRQYTNDGVPPNRIQVIRVS